MDHKFTLIMQGILLLAHVALWAFEWLKRGSGPPLLPIADAA